MSIGKARGAALCRPCTLHMPAWQTNVQKEQQGITCQANRQTGLATGRAKSTSGKNAPHLSPVALGWRRVGSAGWQAAAATELLKRSGQTSCGARMHARPSRRRTWRSRHDSWGGAKTWQVQTERACQWSQAGATSEQRRWMGAAKIGGWGMHQAWGREKTEGWVGVGHSRIF